MEIFGIAVTRYLLDVKLAIPWPGLRRLSWEFINLSVHGPLLFPFENRSKLSLSPSMVNGSSGSLASSSCTEEIAEESEWFPKQAARFLDVYWHQSCLNVPSNSCRMPSSCESDGNSSSAIQGNGSHFPCWPATINSGGYMALANSKQPRQQGLLTLMLFIALRINPYLCR